MASSTNYICLHDGAGSLCQLVDRSDGSVNAKCEYDACGDVIGPDDDGDGDWRDDAGPYAAANSFRFSTKYWDDETGLGYWGRRYYLPRLGRWATPNLSSFALFGPDVFSLNNPASLASYSMSLDTNDSTGSTRRDDRRVERHNRDRLGRDRTRMCDPLHRRRGSSSSWWDKDRDYRLGKAILVHLFTADGAMMNVSGEYATHLRAHDYFRTDVGGRLADKLPY